MGDTVFGNMTMDLLTKSSPVSLCGPQITESQYKQWKKNFCWEALKGRRFGEEFCSHFGAVDNILFFERDIDRAEQHIRNYYISE